MPRNRRVAHPLREIGLPTQERLPIVALARQPAFQPGEQRDAQVCADLGEFDVAGAQAAAQLARKLARNVVECAW